MIIIHYDFKDGSEVSYAEGLLLGGNFTTNCLSFFSTSREVTVKKEDGSYINSLELLKNTGEYTEKEIRVSHNIYRMLVAGAFRWKQPEDNR